MVVNTFCESECGNTNIIELKLIRVITFKNLSFIKILKIF